MNKQIYEQSIVGLSENNVTTKKKAILQDRRFWFWNFHNSNFLFFELWRYYISHVLEGTRTKKVFVRLGKMILFIWNYEKLKKMFIFKHTGINLIFW